MSSLWVVLDTKSDRAARRIGRVQESDEAAATGAELTVEWPDGSLERVKLSPAYRKFRLDTLSAMVEFAPDQLAQELESSPLPFARALAEKPKVYLRSKELLALVCERGGVDKPAADRAWKAQRKAFESMPEVHVEQTGSGAKYHLRQPLPLIELGPVLGQQAEVQAASQAAPAMTAEEAAGISAPVTELEASQTPAEEVVVDSVEIGESEKSSPADIAGAMSLRNPPHIDPDSLDAWFNSDAPSLAIADGATALERLRTQPDAHAERLAGFSLLVGRILKRPDSQIPPEALAKAFVALRRSAVESDRRRGLEALERSIAVLTKPTEFLSRIDRPAFQAALAELPFVEGGARARLLVVLARSNKSAVDDAAWWRGFGWSDVLAVSSGPLSTVITNSEKLMTMVRGVADGFARDVTTRRSLSVLLGAPRFSLEHFAPERMRSIFETVAQNDELFARWQAELSGAAERDDLTRRVLKAEEDARRASAAQDAAAADVDDLSTQLAKVQGQLGHLQAESAGLSGRERRQVLIDAAKVVAQVAATVEGDGRSLDHDALARKVTLLAERFGLHADAHPGDSVAFDPSRHSAPGTRPEVGEIVDVARAGYIWEDGNERVVVLPALVTRASGSEDGA